MKNVDCWIFDEDSTDHETFLRFSELIVDMTDFYFHACMIDARVRDVQPQL